MQKKEEIKTVKGIAVSKDKDFSEWYGELVQKAELADMRYNIKGFVCYMPWATISIKRMYAKYETLLEKKGHLPLVMPSLIPEENFKLESDHVEGFAPEVFWVTETGDGQKLPERLALRPTSETALYRMYSYWVRSYQDLPFKRYQSCQVWRAESTKATRPFFRGREFHWIETHNVFATEEDAKKQVLEDMETTHEMLEDEFAIPILFFQRPEWDKFPGAVHTYAADALMDSGKVLQLPSTHLLGTNFSKPFNVTYAAADGTTKLGHITCYGPAISRIYGAMVAILGDDKGLILPFDLAPVQVVIVPIIFKGSQEDVMNKCHELQKTLSKHYIVKLDDRDGKTSGEKFNEWELKGVPFRIELGPKDLEKKQVVVVNRATKEKSPVAFDELDHFLKTASKEFTLKLKESKLAGFKDYIVNCKSLAEVKHAVDSKKMARVGFCSTDLAGAKCAAVVEKEADAYVRGKKVGKEDVHFEKCVICGHPAKETAYIAKSY